MGSKNLFRFWGLLIAERDRMSESLDHANRDVFKSWQDLAGDLLSHIRRPLPAAFCHDYSRHQLKQEALENDGADAAEL